MFNMKKLFLSLFIFMFLSGCGIIYSINLSNLERTLTDADYGNPPKNYEILAEKYIKSLLKDSDSAQFRNWTVPEKCLFPSNTSMTEPKPGYCNYVEVNAKNSFGGYTGFSVWKIRWYKGMPYGHTYYKPSRLSYR